MPARRPTAASKRAARKKAAQAFQSARRAEKSYARQLRGVAVQVGVIVRGFAPDGKVRNLPALNNALAQYSQLIKPWAAEVSGRMLGEVNAENARAWIQHSAAMGQAMTRELLHDPTGQVMQMLLHEQVGLITSLPTQAAERVHHLTIEAMSSTSARAADIAKEIQRTGHVTESRAKLIARTEVARTASKMTESRAQYVGSTHYIWRTVGDSDVRHEHKILNGKVIDWNYPPVAGSNGERAHAGQIYNCRCYPEPILPDIIL